MRVGNFNDLVSISAMRGTVVVFFELASFIAYEKEVSTQEFETLDLRSSIHKSDKYLVADLKHKKAKSLLASMKPDP